MQKATARAGLLHDLFYYDWRVTKFDRGTHAWIHPRIAVRNAEKLTVLTPREKRYHYQTHVGRNDLPSKVS